MQNNTEKDYTIAIVNPQFTRIKSLVASKAEKEFAEKEVQDDPRGLEYSCDAAVRVVYEMIYVDPFTFELRDPILLKRLRIWFYRLQWLFYKGTDLSLKLMLKYGDLTSRKYFYQPYKEQMYLICKAVQENNIKISNI